MKAFAAIDIHCASINYLRILNEVRKYHCLCGFCLIVFYLLVISFLVVKRKVTIASELTNDTGCLW